MKPAALLPVESAESSAVVAAPRRWVIALPCWAAIAAVWVLFLAAITWRTANPPVINWVQIAESDHILVGEWEERAAGRFQVAQELLQGQLTGMVTVTGLPDRGQPTGKSWVIPVTRQGAKYVVTQGDFKLRPPRMPDQRPAEHWDVRVAPQCYPATDDVRRQIEQELTLLKSKQP